ncbi:MAG: ABC transporter permease [Bacteroidota bacterium]
MFFTNLRIAFRHLRNNKFFTALNIAGLGLGMAVAISIGLWLWDEMSYNQYHDNYERICNVMQNNTFDGVVETWWSQPKQTAPALRDNYGSHFEHVVRSSWSGTNTLRTGDDILNFTGVFAEPGLPHMLSLRMLDGTRAGLEDPYSILVSEQTAVAIFGTTDVVDEVVNLNEEYEVKIAGVFEKPPANSSFSGLELLGTWELYEKGLPEWVGWGNSWFRTLAQVKEGADLAEVSNLIKDLKMDNAAEDEGLRFDPQLFLHPMSDWRFYSEFENGISVGGRITYFRAFAIIGLIVLLLACINFMNLSTARSEKRAREVGIRKTMGSRRGQLVSQFYSESLLLSFAGAAIALLLVVALLPFFNEVADKELALPWSAPQFWLALGGFCLLTGGLAGSYPALYLSSFAPVNALKGVLSKNMFNNRPREVLVVLQFTISLILIIGTIVVFQQTEFAKDRPIGYTTDGVIGLPLRGPQIDEKFSSFREELLATGMVQEASKSETSIAATYVTNSGFNWEGKPDDFQDEFVTMRVGHEFGNVIGWNIKEGRDFSREFAQDTLAFVINEAAVAYLGFDDPIGQQIDWGDGEIYTIIGVVEDLVTQSPYTPVKQMMFFIDESRAQYSLIKLKPGVSTNEALAAVEGVYTKFDPVNTFDYSFIDQQHSDKFEDENRLGKLAGFFTLLAIFISCLGLFGMAAYVSERRSREIGIRKVLGATIYSIVNLISTDFLKLVAIALVFATPVAYWVMQGWLQDYAYRIEIRWWVFALAGGLALGIALFTVGLQSLKAALRNPVEAIRND